MQVYANNRLPSLVECASALGGHDGYDYQERLEAIRRLQVAPAFEAWDKALIFSLSYPDQAIREAGIKACLARLHAFADRYAQSIFLRRLLDFCFHDLAKESEEARAQVFQEVATFLREHKDELEPRFQALISLLVAWSWNINFAHDQKALARVVIRTQNEFSKGERSDHQAAAELDFYRRVEAYRTLGIAESTLLAYLDVDHHFPLDETFPVELFEAYNTLLHKQALKHAHEAHLAVFKNLSKWLSDLPNNLAQRVALIKDIERVQKGASWEEVDFRLRLHLEAHQALLPGPEAPNDLLVLLKTKYTHPAGEAVLAKALQTLRYLPGLRNRLPELCDYLKSDAMSGLRLNVWQAALELVESLLTGLSETELAPTTNADGEPISRKERREQRKRTRARREALKHDRQLRDFLYTVATNKNKNYLPEVRQQAWRILLRTLPEEKGKYYSDGMTKVDSLLFEPSLDIAGETHQRFTWEFISDSWQTLIAPHQEPQKRRERLQKVCQVLAILRPLQFVARHQNDEPPRLIALALDDPDEEVKQFAKQAIQQAGFTKELEREIQRRKLEEWREKQTRIHKEIVRLEQQLKQLNAQLTDCRIRRHTLTSQVEVGLLEREGIVTQGHLTNARLTIDLREVQVELAAALQRAERQERVLHQLAREIVEPLRQLQGARDEIHSLVKKQERWEREINDLERKIDNLRRDISNNQSAIQRAQREIGRLRGQEDSDSQIRRLRNDIDSRNQSIRSAESRLSGLRSQIQRAQSEVASLERPIRNEEARAERLGRQVDQLRGRANAAMRTLEEIRREINRLIKRANEIIQTNDQLQHQMTEAQQVAQDIELGRKHYDQFSEQAKQDNPQADETARKKQVDFEDQKREIDDSLFIYAYYTQQALRQQQAARGR